MEILSCTFGMTFEPNNEVRKAIFNLEEHMPGFCKPFTMIPVPDETPLTIPRITAVSENEHTTLFVSKQNAQVRSNFDEEFSGDVEKCLSYSKEKAMALLETLKESIDRRLLFSGLTTEVDCTDMIGEERPAQFILENFTKVSSALELDDSKVQVTYIYDSSIYLNIEVRQSLFMAGGVPDEPFSLEGREADKRLIVTLDFNDRFSFNMNSKYQTSVANGEKVYALTQRYLNEKIESFLEQRLVNE